MARRPLKFIKIFKKYIDWEESILNNPRVSPPVTVAQLRTSFEFEREWYSQFNPQMGLVFNTHLDSDDLMETILKIEFNPQLFFFHELFYMQNFRKGQEWLKSV